MANRGGHREWFRSALTELTAAAGSPDPTSTAAALVLLRAAMLVGNYLDGVAATFGSTARAVAGLD